MIKDEPNETTLEALLQLLSQIAEASGLQNIKFELGTGLLKDNFASGSFSLPEHSHELGDDKMSCAKLNLPCDGAQTGQVTIDMDCVEIISDLKSYDGSYLNMLNRPVAWGGAMRVVTAIIYGRSLTNTGLLPATEDVREQIKTLIKELDKSREL